MDLPSPGQAKEKHKQELQLPRLYEVSTYLLLHITGLEQGSAVQCSVVLENNEIQWEM